MSLEPRTTPPAGPLTLLALLLALATAAGSVILSWPMNLVPCPLCYYQRTFIFACAGVLLMGVASGMGRTTALSALALPLAAGGLGVAGFHVWLEQTGVLECPGGILDLGTAPRQSLAAFALLLLILLSDAWNDLRPGGGWSASMGAILLGLLLAAACVLSAQKLPEPPTQPYPDVPKTCRRPYA